MKLTCCTFGFALHTPTAMNLANRLDPKVRPSLEWGNAGRLGMSPARVLKVCLFHAGGVVFRWPSYMAQQAPVEPFS